MGLVANVATYPPRLESLRSMLSTIVEQIDVINLVLNGFGEPPSILSEFNNINPIIPDHDTKDAGKFYLSISPDDVVFLMDDDILFDKNYVQYCLNFLKETERPAAFGFHGSIYLGRQGPLGLARRIASRRLGKPISHIRRRRVFPFNKELAADIIVDQIGTGAAFMYGSQLPPYSYMKDAQMFTDVRFARWCAERGTQRICPRRPAGLLRPLVNETSIWKSFTRNTPVAVRKEIDQFAGQENDIGKALT